MKKNNWIYRYFLFIFLMNGCLDKNNILNAEKQSIFTNTDTYKNHHSYSDAREFDHVAINKLKFLGSHNSYHQRPEKFILSDWDYEAPKIEEQLRKYKVRNFELDVHARYDDLTIKVMHIPHLDEGTSCDNLSKCIEIISKFHEEEPLHTPIFLHIEPKTFITHAKKNNLSNNSDHSSEYFNESDFLNEINQILLEGLGHILYLPSDFQSGYKTIKEARNQRGWPSLKEMRGKVLCSFHSRDKYLDEYIKLMLLNKNFKHGVCFVPHREESSFINISSLNIEQNIENHIQNNSQIFDESILWAYTYIDDPLKEFSQIQKLHSDHFLIRTRVDIVPYEKNSSERYQKAILSNASLLSSDHLDYNFGQNKAYRISWLCDSSACQ